MKHKTTFIAAISDSGEPSLPARPITSLAYSTLIHLSSMASSTVMSLQRLTFSVVRERLYDQVVVPGNSPRSLESHSSKADQFDTSQPQPQATRVRAPLVPDALALRRAF